MFSDNQISEFSSKGYLYLESFIPEQEVQTIKTLISKLSKNERVDIYSDRNGKLRRMERFTNLDDSLISLNKKIIEILKQLTNENYVLFKDKVNFKPPRGEGFYAHYDGVFQFHNGDGILKNGWYEYADEFLNVLITLDDFTLENGTLELSEKHQLEFEELLANTLGGGCPDLIKEVEDDCNFVPMICKKGSLVIFEHTCPHRSAANNSIHERGSLYWTYNKLRTGDLYDQYFSDKASSVNKNKALLGEIKSPVKEN